MRKVRSISILAMAILGATGCQTLLDAGFEGDRIGGFPDTSLPGAPSGDSLYVASLGTEPTANCVRVVDSPLVGASEGGKALLLDSSATGRGTKCRTLGWFISAPTAEGNAPYAAIWQSYVGTNLDSGLSFGFHHRRPVISIDFQGQQALLSIGGDVVATGNFRPFETYTGTVNFDPEAQTYSVSLSGAGATLRSDGSYEHTASMGSSGERLGLIFSETRIPSGGVDGPGAIIVDNVLMTEADPDR